MRFSEISEGQGVKAATSPDVTFPCHDLTLGSDIYDPPSSICPRCISHAPRLSRCLLAQVGVTWTMFGGNFSLFVLFVCYRTMAKIAFISSFAPRVLSCPLELDYSHSCVSIAPCSYETVSHTKDKVAAVVADALGKVEVGIDRVAVDGVELGAEDGDVVIALDAELNVLSGAGEVWRRR